MKLARNHSSFLVILHFSFFLCLRFFYIVLSAEALDAAGGVHEFLFAREEGMAGRANFNLDVPDGGTCLYDIAAGATYLCHLVLGMNLFLHIKNLTLKTSLNSGRSGVH